MQGPWLNLYMFQPARLDFENLGSVAEAFQRDGAFFLRVRDMDSAILTHALQLQARLFNLSSARKSEFICPMGGGQRGWIPFNIEKAEPWSSPDPKECWHISRAGGHVENFWPSENEDFRTVFQALYKIFDDIAVTVMHRLGDELGLNDPHFMHQHNSVLRLVQYRDVGTPWLAGEHFDVNLFTIRIYESNGGCQFKRNEKWFDLAANDGFLITAGQMLNHLSNDRIQAVRHRVAAPTHPGELRQFAGYFVNPALNAWLPCLPGEGAEPRYTSKPNLELLADRARDINHG